MRRSPAVLVSTVLAAAIASCRAPATYVEVIVATDADPSRAWELAACVVRAGQPLPEDPARCEHRWTRAAGSAAAAFEGSFSVLPPSSWNGVEPIDLALFATAGASGLSPSVSFRRRARFTPVRGQPAFVRVFLPVSCGQESADCALSSARPCTVALACEERGQTCGDDGVCVQPELPVIARPQDASTDALARFDVQTRDAQTRDVVTMDAIDASDASDAADVADASDALIPAVRLVYPLPDLTVRPNPIELSWNPTLTSATVELCADRACAMVSASYSVSNAARFTLPSVARAASFFWRVVPTEMPVRYSPSGARRLYTTASGCLAPPVYDFTGDGLGDVAASAHSATIVTFTNSGYVSYFRGRNPTPETTSALMSYVNVTDAHYGSGLSFGDINGDGQMDTLIGVPGGSTQLTWSNLATMQSRHLNLGAAAGLERAGNLAAIGDLDRDGQLEVAVADRATNMAALRVFTVTSTFATLRWTLSAPTTELGYGLASYCDLDGDSVPELVAGAPQWDANGGAVLIYRGAAASFGGTSWDLGAQTVVRCVGAGDRCGAWVSCGDVNGDGRQDLVIGAPGLNGGSVIVLRSTSATSIAFAAPVRYNAIAPDERFGTSVSAGRDFDGDGVCDFAVGAQNTRYAGQVNAGAVSLYAGAMTLPTMPFATLSSGVAGWQFGHAVSLLGDTNGDGRADLLVGADLASMTRMNAGRVFLYLGTNTRMVGAPVVQANGSGVGDTFGGVLVR